MSSLLGNSDIATRCLRKEFTSPRIKKVKHFQKERWAHYLDIKASQDIDAELIDWVRQSYE